MVQGAKRGAARRARCGQCAGFAWGFALLFWAGFALDGAFSAQAWACSRARSPFEELPVGVAVADVVLEGEALTVGGGRATVRVLERWKGAEREVAATVVVQGVYSRAERPMSSFCGVPTLEVGQRYVLLLWRAPGGDGATFRLVDAAAGVQKANAAGRTAVLAALRAPAPRSEWTRTADGLESLLVATPPASGTNAGDVDLLVVVRNAGEAARRFTVRSWPERAQSRCTLDVVHAGSGAQVRARPVPIKRRDVTAYFSKHGRRYEVAVAPGESALIRLPRATTAAAGWGYKEELGFRYWPVRRAGPHRISATCVRFFGPASTLTTGALVVGVRPPVRGLKVFRGK